ncbi:MAG: hypothetical protein V3V62_03725, partial [bacterium]
MRPRLVFLPIWILLLTAFLHPTPASGQEKPRLNVLYTGVLGSGCRQPAEEVNAQARKRIGKNPRFRLLPEERLKEATGGKAYEVEDYAADNYRLAREVGRKAGAEVVILLEREVETSGFGRVCTATTHFVSVEDPEGAFQVRAEYSRDMSREEKRSVARTSRKKLFAMARRTIRRALARKARTAVASRPAPSGAATAKVEPSPEARERQRNLDEERPGRLRRAQANLAALRRQERKRLAALRRREKKRRRAALREIQKERERPAGGRRGGEEASLREERRRAQREAEEEKRLTAKAQAGREREGDVQKMLLQEMAELKKQLAKIEKEKEAARLEEAPWKSS